MRDTELSRHLLGLVEPWTVERVALDVKGQRVEVWARHPAGTEFPCSECGARGRAGPRGADLAAPR